MRGQVLDEITRRICAVSQPEKIILFGSYARCESGSDSDIDLLVILADSESTRRESVRLRGVLRGLKVPIDVLVATTQQIERHQHTPGLIYATALCEGHVLYDRNVAS
jgi:uncharacterized protein